MEPLEPPPRVPWYFRRTGLVTLFLAVGPFMLPLVWMSPALDKGGKVRWTAGIGLVTLLLVAASAKAVSVIYRYYELLGSL